MTKLEMGKHASLICQLLILVQLKIILCALKFTLQKYNLDFSKAIGFLSDTASVMKGCRSGVQILIKNQNPKLYEFCCICHADLCIKAGVKTLPLDIDQIFIDIYYYFHHSSNVTRHLLINGTPFMTQSLK